MARKSAVVNEEEPNYVPFEFEDNDSWESVAEASPTLVVFDTKGDVFIGKYQGVETITPEDESKEPFKRLVFTDKANNRFAINPSYKLEKTFEDVSVGSLCRIEYVGEIETGRNLNPMKDFTVRVKRA